MLGIKLTMLPRWVKHDFWRQAEPQNGRGKEKVVDEIINAIDETVEVVGEARGVSNDRSTSGA
jgi:hypothetical protein